jgi:ABC-type branched-subunit amino acid transport system ATPase component
MKHEQGGQSPVPIAVEPVLTIDEVKVHFGGVRAVDGVSLSLNSDRLYGLVGPNGSGKSTLLAALSKLVPLTSGRLNFRGHDYEDVDAAAVARLGIARTFQTVRLVPDLTILENVMIGAEVNYLSGGLTRAWLLPLRSRRHAALARKRAIEALETLGITSVAHQYPGSLAYGTQRKVELARALASDPVLLLLDEPTAGMGRTETDEIGHILGVLRSQGMCQVLVEHDLQMITDVCDEVFVISMGKLIASGDPDTVVNLPEVQEAYLGKVAAHEPS